MIERVAAALVLVIAARPAAADDAQVAKRLTALEKLRRFVSADLDLGFFATGGNGAGIRYDVGHQVFPEYASLVPAAWVFLGDPLSTAINARGEPADAGPSRSLAPDRIASGGDPTALVNSLGLTIARDVTPELSLRARVELLPRAGDDVVDVAIARIEYRPPPVTGLLVTAGVVDSVLGIEYRSQDAPDRLTVTPSLACRYTCGRPVGVQGRLRRGGSTAAVSVAATDSFIELLDAERAPASGIPTASARVARRLPIASGLELGMSAAIGPQAAAIAPDDPQWHVGLDLQLHVRQVEVLAELVQGRLPGAEGPAMPTCDAAPCLRYRAAYALAGWRVNNWLTPYLRVDWRDALHASGADFVYVSKLARATFGAHLDLDDRAILKFEYTWNRELGRIPQFPDDVFTTSIVLATD